VAVGDILLHETVYNDFSIDGKTFDFSPLFENVRPYIEPADFAFANQETNIGGVELGLSAYPNFNSPYEIARDLINVGFNMFARSNNHTLDKGEKAVISSRNYWNTQKDVLAVGSYSSFDERNNIKIIEKNNITYTMLNYTYGTNGMTVPEGKEYLVNVWPTNLDLNNVENDIKYQEYKKQVKTDIESIRQKIDILIVAMHWGIEYTHEPTEYQKDMANYLASLDVDIVIGTHPHVIQPIEWIDNTLVFYSLGNFISAQYQNENYNKVIGLMSSLEIHKKEIGNTSEITIKNIDNDLIYTYYNNWRNFKVIPFSNPEISNYLSDYKNIYNRYKSIVQEYDNSISVKSIT